MSLASRPKTPARALKGAHKHATLLPFLNSIYNIYGDCTYGAPGRQDASGRALYSKAPVPMLRGPQECIDETIAKCKFGAPPA